MGGAGEQRKSAKRSPGNWCCGRCYSLPARRLSSRWIQICAPQARFHWEKIRCLYRSVGFPTETYSFPTTSRNLRKTQGFRLVSRNELSRNELSRNEWSRNDGSRNEPGVPFIVFWVFWGKADTNLGLENTNKRLLVSITNPPRPPALERVEAQPQYSEF